MNQSDDDILRSVLKERISGEIEELASRQENLGLRTLEPELYPFMSHRELRMSILLGTHTTIQPRPFNDSIAFTSSFSSKNCNVTVRDGIYSFNKGDKTSPGITLEFTGTWLINPRHGNASLGTGKLVVHVTNRSEDDGSQLLGMDKLQNFYINLNRAGEEDNLIGVLIIDPLKWSRFTDSLNIINEKTWITLFNQVIACEPGFDYGIPNGKSFPCIGPVYSVGGSDFLITSGNIAPAGDIAFNKTLMIKKPDFIRQELIEYVMETNDVDEAGAKKIIMKLPTEDYAVISSHPSTTDMAIGFKLLKSWGLNPKIQSSP